MVQQGGGAGTCRGAVYARRQLQYRPGVKPDDIEAAKWFQRSADQGYAPAQANLALLYDHGQGVPQSDDDAIKWYRLAADQDEPHAQHGLGEMYRNGYGVERDLVEAYKWTNLAAQQGHIEAMGNLSALAKRMTPEEIAQGQAAAAAWSKR